jgi:hypothetical protein
VKDPASSISMSCKVVTAVSSIDSQRSEIEVVIDLAAMPEPSIFDWNRRYADWRQSVTIRSEEHNIMYE